MSGVWNLNPCATLVTDAAQLGGMTTLRRRSVIVLKFFIHKLDAGLQSTVHGQNFKCKMRNKSKASQLCKT